MKTRSGEAFRPVLYDNGLWKKLGPEALSDFLGFPNQQDDIRNILILVHKFPGYPSLDEVAVQEVVDTCYRGNCQTLIKQQVGNILNVMKIHTFSSV
jgi:hypothetical protein